MGNKCRLRLHKRIGPALDNAALHIDGELRALGIEHGLDELPFQPLADLEGLAGQMNVAMGCNLTDERHTSSGDGQQVERDDKTRGQLSGYVPAQLSSHDVFCLQLTTYVTQCHASYFLSINRALLRQQIMQTPISCYQIDSNATSRLILDRAASRVAQ